MLSVVLVLIFLVWPFIKAMLMSMERMAFEQRVESLRRATEFKVAEYVALNSMQDVKELINENPWRWQAQDSEELEDSLEVEQLDINTQSRGEWIYEKERQFLSYRFYFTENLVNESPWKDSVQFKLQLEYQDINEDGRFDEGIEPITGLLFLPRYAYAWRTTGD